MKAAHFLSLFALAALCPTPVLAQDDLGRSALEHEDYDKWNSVRQDAMTEDGAWAAFTVRPVDRQSLLTIRELGTQVQYTVPGGSSLRFTYDNRFAVYLIQPDPELVKKLKEDKEDVPDPQLEILDLESGQTVTLDRVRSFRLPEEASGWVAYSPAEPRAKGVAKAGKSDLEETYAIGPEGLTKIKAGEMPVASEPQPEAKEEAKGEGETKPASKEDKPKEDKDLGKVLVLRNLATGDELRFPDVTSHVFDKAGARLAMARSARDAENDGVFVMDLASGDVTQILAGRGGYQSLAFAEDGQQLVFLSDRDDYGPAKPSMSMYLWTGGPADAQKIVHEGAEGMPDGWWVASNAPRFTEDGRRIMFSTQPKHKDAGKTDKQIEKEAKEAKEDPQAQLDIWHWQDGTLQPQQLLNAARERGRSYSAIFDLKQQKMLQLANQDMPDARVDARSEHDLAIGTSSLKYEVMQSWDTQGFSDSYLIDLNTGESSLLFEKARARVSLSPEGSYLTWWDPELAHYFAMSTTDRVAINLTEGMPVGFANELHDTPSLARSYGSAGWLADDAAVLIYDRFDIWQLDPTGAEPARNLTGGKGRDEQRRYRYVSLDSEARSVDTTTPLFLSTFDEDTKASGYATLDVATGTITQELLLDERISGFRKAEQGDRVVLTRQTFRRYPDLWTTTMDFDSMSRLSNANPQQRDYLWGTAELVNYDTTDGQTMQGLLYKPDNFDPSKKYPMMVYFYERSSDRLHNYQTPSAGSSSINYSFYVSRGYVIFVPDIPYETGYPGESAAKAILPGIQSIVDKGFVDEARIGVQGHSWGGYQIAYLVTMTNVFACAESGAPVSNMTSAYGGIRWASGMSRMFQYEKTQSRIGGTLWDSRDLYLENSPVFFADKIETPLLILHNDADGAVPWYQGIELFVALRRLSKPAWMLNYNNEGHGIRKKENRLDFAKRMQQYFDHYLMDAPAPMWLSEGVPATLKGEEFGFDPVPAEVPAGAEEEEAVQTPSPAEEPVPQEEPPIKAAG